MKSDLNTKTRWELKPRIVTYGEKIFKKILTHAPTQEDLFDFWVESMRNRSNAYMALPPESFSGFCAEKNLNYRGKRDSIFVIKEKDPRVWGTVCEIVVSLIED